MTDGGHDASATSGTTSTSLLARVKGHDADAWTRLVKRYGPIVYGWARQRGLQADDAADVVQEVFFGVAQDIAKFRNDGPNDGFRRWLWSITRNSICDRFRAMAAEPQAAGGTDAHRHLQQLAMPPLEGDGADPFERGRLKRRALELLMGEFHENAWQAFWCVAVNGDRPVDVAEDLGVSVWAVYKARTRVLQRLNLELKELGD